ncbi:MAG: MFS family permease [Saprospiraceae bacterium]|jgi:MFS family permease
MTPRRILIILTLVLSGEMIFILPFVLVRVFRPTFLTVFGINNFELGTAFSVYGVVALCSYFFGGMIADRYPIHRLIGISLLVTGLGGFVLASLPSLDMIIYVYSYWGMTTILLFWAAMIKATRLWGGETEQGRAFGLLEGGRGTVAALIGTIGVGIFSYALPSNDSSDISELSAAFQKVLWVASCGVMLVGIVSWIVLRSVQSKIIVKQNKLTWSSVKSVIGMPTVYLQGIIIVCAYVGYKITDNLSLYASDVLHYSDVAAAQVGTLSLWMRPVAAISAGVLADRFTGIRMTMISFGLVAIGAGFFASGILTDQLIIMFFIILLTTSLGIYGLRGLYFAIMQEGKIPVAYTGTAVGLMSVLGYTPDIFMGPINGYLLDRSPGIVGHQHVFMVLILFSIIGMIATYYYQKYAGRIEDVS